MNGIHTIHILFNYFGAVISLGAMATKKNQSADADGTSGVKMSAKEKIKGTRKKRKQREKRELKAIKFVAIEFAPDDYKIGEAELNACIKDGFLVVKDYQTASGVVMTLGKYGKKTKK